MAAPENKWLIMLAFGAIYLVWGSSYLAVVYGLKSFPPFLLGALRYLMAGFILFIWGVAMGQKEFSIHSILKNALVGFLALIGGSFSVLWGQQYLPSGLAAIIIGALPFGM